MFEAISFLRQNRQDAKNPIDIGALVECMLFYEKTTVVADRGIMTQLLKYFGPERLFLLIEENLLNIIYTESQIGIFTKTERNIQYHDAVEIALAQKAGSPIPYLYQDELREICIHVTGKEGKGRRLATRLQNKIQVTRHNHLILKGARNSILA